MHLSKKNKILLSTLVPVGVIVVASTASVSGYLIHKNNVEAKLSRSKNYGLSLVDQQNITSNVLPNTNLFYNPYNFTLDFFVDKIANKEVNIVENGVVTNKKINTNSLLFNFNVDEQNNPNSKSLKPNNVFNGITYEVVKVEKTQNDSGKFLLSVDVVKRLKGFKSRPYKVYLNNGPFISNEEDSKKNFLSSSIDIAKSALNSFDLSIKLKPTATGISKNDLLMSGSNEYPVTSSPSGYMVSNPIFSYSNNQKITFSIEDIFVVGERDAIKTKFDELKKNSSNVIDANYLSDLDSANIYYPVLMKMNLVGDASSAYFLTYQSVLSNSGSIVENAPEIALTITKDFFDANGILTQPTFDEISENIDLIKLAVKPTNGLVYTIEKIETSSEFQDKIIAHVEISHPDVKETKKYSYTITKGIKSKQQYELEKYIDGIIGIGKNKDLKKIIPTTTFDKTSLPELAKNNIDLAIEHLNSLIKKNDITSFNSIVTINYPSGVDKNKVIYVPTMVTIGLTTNNILVTYNLASKDNPNAIYPEQIFVESSFT